MDISPVIIYIRTVIVVLSIKGENSCKYQKASNGRFMQRA